MEYQVCWMEHEKTLGGLLLSFAPMMPDTHGAVSLTTATIMVWLLLIGIPTGFHLDLGTV